MNRLPLISAMIFVIGCSKPGNKYFTGTIEYAYTYSSDSLNADSLAKTRPARSLLRYDTINYQSKLINNANGLKGLGIDNKAVVKTIEEISQHVEIIKTGVRDMIEERKRINKITDTHKRAIAYCDDIKEKYFDKIRDSVDKLEHLVDNDDWPLVKYRELLFLR